jgi:NADP-dependent 3-hydroxy acid dehydrogenase YdfG
VLREARPVGVSRGLDVDDWTRCYQVNVLGVAAVIYAAVPLLAAAGGGAVVTVA